MQHQCDQIWQVAVFWVDLVFGKILAILWQKIVAIAQIFIVLNGQILSNDLNSTDILNTLPPNYDVFVCTE